MTPHTTSTDQGCLSVFCLNLRFGLADDGPNNWDHRKAAFPDLLEQHASDFYAFQEANDFQITYLQGLLGQWKCIGQRLAAPDFWQNNVIFHHQSWDCLSHEHFYLSDTPDVPSKFKQSRWPRQCTMGTFERDGFRVTAVNTHFDFEPVVQRQSAVLILERLAQIAPQWPVILMGDFNAGPNSSCLAELLTQKPGGFKSALWPPTGGTHHNFSGVALGEPIDWILYRGDLDKCDAHIVTDKFNGIYPSDHFALSAAFKFCFSCR